MKMIKCFNLYYEHGGDNFFLERVAIGSFLEMVNTWLYYLQTDFKEGNNIKFFHYLNNRYNLPKYYRFDNVCFSSDFYQNCLSYEHMIWLWKRVMKDYQCDFISLLAKNSFFNGLSENRLPSIFDYLFNIWIQEIDDIPYHYYKQYTYLEKYEKINCLQYLIMKLRGQII